MLKNLKVQVKILVIFLLAGILPVLVISLISIVQSRATLIDTIFTEIELFQQMKEHSIEDYLNQKVEEGWNLSRISRIYSAVNTYNQSGPNDEWNATYSNFDQFIPAFAERYDVLCVYITDAKGLVIYGSGTLKEKIEGADLSIREYYTASMAGNANISAFAYSSIIDDYYIAVSTPIRQNGEGIVIGTINLLIPIPTLQNMLQDGITVLGTSANVYTVDETGLLFSNATHGKYSQNAAFKETLSTQAFIDLEEHLKNKELDYIGSSLYKDADGTKVIGGYGIVSIGVTELGLITEISQAEGFYSINALIKTVLLITGLTIVIALVLIFFGAKSITNPIKDMVDHAKELADGHLDIHIHHNSKDEIGELSSALRRVIQSMHHVLSSIHTASVQVASGSIQLSDSSMSLSQGATEQASSVEELTARIEEVTSQIVQNSKNSHRAKEISQATESLAHKGNEQMSALLDAMSDISQASHNISTIIKVIDEIAFQTNILALNAAVEAARAGQHGKGFAVVAEEVRNLAARSAQAANETTEMIQNTISKVELGTELTQTTAAALKKIVEGVTESTELSIQIAKASEEQANSIEQINQGISQISDVVQITSATAQESAAASEELSGQAEILKAQVATFRL